MRDLAPHNRQLLDFIKLHQPVGSAFLFDNFDGAGESRGAFSKRLHYLKGHDWLTSTGHSTHAVWSVNADARPMHTGARNAVTRAARYNTHKSIAAHNLELVDFIAQRQPADTASLFADFDGAGENEHAFGKRLHYLKLHDWLISTRSHNRTVWSVNRAALGKLEVARRDMRKRNPAATPAAAPDDYVPVVTPPRTINRMAGFYVPPCAPAGRPGSDDHRSLPSLRQGQRVAFVAGYITL